LWSFPNQIVRVSPLVLRHHLLSPTGGMSCVTH
jgi:hypothetical protein